MATETAARTGPELSRGQKRTIKEEKGEKDGLSFTVRGFSQSNGTNGPGVDELQPAVLPHWTFSNPAGTITITKSDGRWYTGR